MNLKKKLIVIAVSSAFVINTEKSCIGVFGVFLVLTLLQPVWLLDYKWIWVVVWLNCVKPYRVQWANKVCRHTMHLVAEQRSAFKGVGNPENFCSLYWKAICKLDKSTIFPHSEAPTSCAELKLYFKVWDFVNLKGNVCVYSLHNRKQSLPHSSLMN